MTKHVLVISFSQTGQLSSIVDQLLVPFDKEQCHIDHIKLDSIYNYPFPWTIDSFFEVFPESVLQIKEPHFLLQHDQQYDKPYDLVLLAYQPWYLSPSIPISTFLQSEFAQRILAGKNIVTVVGCRNMWTQAQEDVKTLIKQVNATLVGSIVLYDKAYNFVSLFTILKWMLYGKKGHSGVAAEDIRGVTRYGEYIYNSLLTGTPINQKKLIELKAINVIPHLALMEQRGKVIFTKFARFVYSSSTPKTRAFRIKLFRIYLLVVILILSPLVLTVTSILKMLFPKKYKKIIAYYSGVE